jgi:RNA polymerase sigma-70 factor (ECF subfamily)
MVCSSPFATTHWSVILSARDESGAGAREALEALCRRYWVPLYVYVRKRGYKPQDAQDLTQAFFVHLFSKDFLQRISRQKGRFRSFLLACLNNFLTDQ